jgi:P27 family predicted phage terminase small subunit
MPPVRGRGPPGSRVVGGWSDRYGNHFPATAGSQTRDFLIQLLKGVNIVARLKKTVEQRALEGLPGKSRVAPVVEKGEVPECPKWLTGIAEEEWNRVAPALHAAGLLTGLDISALEGYVVTYAKWREAEQRLAEEGLTITTPNGCTQIHPAQSISNQTQKLLLSWVRSFGLSPDSRGRMDLPPAPPAMDEDSLFLKKLLDHTPGR